ncbi:MAG: hypothetical protein K1X74_18350 [Pirellulales bacterium]|nr:hypothetical protein [Pirellulales bacterium]
MSGFCVDGYDRYVDALRLLLRARLHELEQALEQATSPDEQNRIRSAVRSALEVHHRQIADAGRCLF